MLHSGNKTIRTTVQKFGYINNACMDTVLKLQDNEISSEIKIYAKTINKFKKRKTENETWRHSKGKAQPSFYI